MITHKKNSILALLISMPVWAFTQNVKTDTKMESVKFTKTMELDITASATSSSNDFDFLEGKWKVHNRRLNERLVKSNSWSEFESTLHMRKVLTGLGNVENYYTSFDGKPFEGLAVRLFNRETKLWTIYWMDTNGGGMDQHPVTGFFEKGLGKFYAKDIFKGKPIIVLYQWDATDPKQPKWSQAFSPDNGVTWEWNWEMTLSAE